MKMINCIFLIKGYFMLLIAFDIILIIILIYFLFYKELDNFYLIIIFFSALAVNLSFLNPYLAMLIPFLIIFLMPFVTLKKPEIKEDDEKQKHEEIDYYNNFKEFLSNYLELLSEKYNFSSLAIYEDQGRVHKLLKLYPIKNFKHASYTIEKSSPIFSALLHSKSSFTTSSNDRIIKNILELSSENKTLSYIHDDYLVFVFHELENEDFLVGINNFLSLFNSLKKQIYLKDYNERLLYLSKGLNKDISIEDTLNTFIKSVNDYIGFDHAMFSFYDEGIHVIKKVFSDNEEVKNLEGTEITDKNSLISLSFENKSVLPSTFRFDYKTNYIMDTNLFDNCKSIIVYPIKEQDKVIGNLTILSKEDYLYNDNIVSNLELMFNIFEVSFLNAKIFRKMQEMATIDGLTGLVNHRTFQEKLDEYLQRAKRYNTKTAVVLMDIDHFKSVNDSYGHPMGDEVLRQVSKILKASVRNVDLVARYGGEEFVLILEEVTKESVYTLTNRIREEIKKIIFNSKGTEFSISISMGFSIFGESSYDKKELISLADKALYFSKENGRDRVSFINDIS